MDYFDLQVNGYGGVDFNQDDLTAEDLHRACVQLRSGGIGGILATIITESEAQMVQRIQRIVELRSADELVRSVITGIHIEGPFLNPQDGYRGAHPVDAIRKADARLAERFLESAKGLIRLVTLAPEQDPTCEVIRMLVDRGVTVSAGHTNASLRQLEEAIEAGLSMFTHFGNGCPMVLPRHDNILQRVLYLREHLWLCLIADGVHIPFPALRNYLDVIGPKGKCLVTTDAMAAAGLGAGDYQLGRWNVRVGKDLAARSSDGSHLIGSAMPMSQVAENLTIHLGLDTATIDLLTKDHPRLSLRQPSLATF